MLDFIEVNTSVLPEHILPYQVTVNLKVDNKLFEDRLLNGAKGFSFYYYERNMFAKLFTKSKFVFLFNDIVNISRISGATVARTFDYADLLHGYSVCFGSKDEARIFSSEIKKYLTEHIQREYRYFDKLVQESAKN